LNFRVERYDGAGNRLAPTGVELRGYRGGQISEGDEVDVKGRWSHGVLRAHRITNVTTGAQVQGATNWIMAVAFVFFAVFVALWILFMVWLIVSSRPWEG